MSDVPVAIPVTAPVEETVAFEGADDIQGLDKAAVGDPINDVVEPTHTFIIPDIVGNALIVNATDVLVRLEQVPLDDCA